jgi:hypothetical protein
MILNALYLNDSRALVTPHRLDYETRRIIRLVFESDVQQALPDLHTTRIQTIIGQYKPNHTDWTTFEGGIV